MGAREEPFAAFVSAYRPRLIGTAALVHLDPARAPALIEAVLAQTYARWPHLDDPYGYALRLVLDPSRAGLRGGAAQPDGFELVDVAHSEANPDGDIRSELAGLSADERQILVLVCYTGLPPAQIAALLQREPADVVAQLGAATKRLQAPRRQGRRRLAAELAAASWLPTTGPRTDHGRGGRAVLRARRIRLAAIAAALVVLAGLGIRQALPPPTTPAIASRANPTSGPPCDITQARCRTNIVATWRRAMAEVISEHLDPRGHYFTGYSYSYTEDYQGSGFWQGRGGALALDLYRVRDGATEVYLQIATSRQYAIRCGLLTGRSCQSQRFMDGNRFLLTDPYDVAHGLEVQHRPEGTYVITVVARNTSKARRELPVTRGDLITLVSDPRLRLPPR